MAIDYQKLAEQTGSYLNDMGKKAAEIAVKGVTAEAWAQFIPSVIALAAAIFLTRFFYGKYKENPHDGYEVLAMIFGIVACLISVWFFCSVHGVVMTHIAPEWVAIKAIAQAIKNR